MDKDEYLKHKHALAKQKQQQKQAEQRALKQESFRLEYLAIQQFHKLFEQTHPKVTLPEWFKLATLSCSKKGSIFIFQYSAWLRGIIDPNSKWEQINGHYVEVLFDETMLEKRIVLDRAYLDSDRLVLFEMEISSNFENHVVNLDIINTVDPEMLFPDDFFENPYKYLKK